MQHEICLALPEELHLSCGPAATAAFSLQAAREHLDARMFGSATLAPPVELRLGVRQLHWLSQHMQAVQHWGWRWQPGRVQGTLVVLRVPVILGKQLPAGALQVSLDLNDVLQ